MSVKRCSRFTGVASLLATVVAGLLIPAAASAAQGVVSEERQARKAATVRYWTPARMRAAEPLPLEHPDERGSGRPPQASDRGKPGSVAPAPPERQALLSEGRTTLNHPARYWSGRVDDYRSYPNRTSGKVFARMPGVGAYECSATVVHARNRSVLFTAGHCVRDPEAGAWASRFLFVPAYRDGSRPFGAWVWKDYTVPARWARDGNFNYDYAAVAVSPRRGVKVQDAVGARGLAWNQERNQGYAAFGYPHNKANGERMWGCLSGYQGGDPFYQPPGPNPIAIGCDMRGGASGGGFVIKRNRYVNSVVSFAYPKAHPDIVYGPYFNRLAARIRSIASNE